MTITRLSILELAARHRLDAPALSSLWRIAHLEAQPPGLIPALRKGFAFAAAVLAGLGLLFLLASNWGALPRGGKFALLQVLIVVSCVGAVMLPRARQALALFGLLSIGGLFATMGQSYQTGADPWQLFALWSALALPLALGARSDVVWSAWVIVAMAGVATWDAAQTGSWRLSSGDLPAHARALLPAITVVILMSRPLSRFSGAGRVSFNLALLFATSSVATVGSIAAFSRWNSAYYGLALLVLATATALLSLRKLFDITALSTASLGLIFLLVLGSVDMFLEGSDKAWFASLLLIGIFAVGLLAFAVWAILSLARRYQAGGAQ